MSAPSTVEFVLKGTIAGNPISLRDGIPFAHFQEFNADVHDFVLGSDSKAVLQDVNIQATEGSYLLRVLIPAGILGTLAGDTARLARPEALAELDPKRAAVVIRWQQRARMDSSLTYCIRSPENEFPPITINQNTGFQFTEKAQWALVEKYLMGKITDWGGEPSCNVHLRLRNSGKIIIIQAKEDSIRGRENLVYQRAVVHVKGKENVKTGELENLTLIDMWPYRPDVDEAQLEQLFEKGRKAWADVPDVGAWLEELREEAMPDGVLLDTSFLISFADPNRTHHAVARSYFSYFTENSIPMFLSTIVASEFHLKQAITDLPLNAIIVLPFNLNDAKCAAELDFQRYKNTAGVSRVALKDDFKLLGQAKAQQINFLITEDARTLYKYCQDLRGQGLLPTRAIKLEDGFLTTHFDSTEQTQQKQDDLLDFDPPRNIKL